MINHSFAVVAYKDSPYLSNCLDSLKAQTKEGIIYLTTSTPSEYLNDISKKYGIQLFVTEPGQGITHDWNFSLQMGKTKYITLAHQDDVYMPEYAENCVKAAEKFNDTLICFTDYTEIIEGEERVNNSLLRIKRFMLWFFMPFKKNLNKSFWKKRLLSIGCPVPAPSVMFNREKLNDFTFSEQFSINMDWEAWYRMTKMKGRFVYVKKKLLKHRIHAESATTFGIKENLRQKEDLIMFKKFWPGFIAKLLSRFYARSYKSNNSSGK